MNEIAIPAALLPSDGRFGSGPSKVSEQALRDLAATGSGFMGTSHRQPAVKSVVGKIREGLAELFGMPAGYELILGNGGSTAFWDIATFALIESKSQHVVCGEFTSKFAQSAQQAPFLEAPSIVAAETGTWAPCFPEAGVDAYAWAHNETSTGVMAPVQRVAGEGLTLIDGTSAAGGALVDLSQTDAYYFAPQKALAGDGGLWLSFLSPAALERSNRVLESRWVPPFLDLRIAIENSAKDQTYNTPALSTIFLLAHQIDWMIGEGGLEAMASRSQSSSSILYRWAEASPVAAPFVGTAEHRSTVVVTIDFVEEVDAARLAAVLRANGIVDVEPYRKLGRNQLRISTFPLIETDDIVKLTQSLDFVLEVLSR